MTHSIHIISFDVPFPANYGGVIDVYYKLWWLKQAGVKIHLHCFTYGRQPAKELELLCEEVFYYERKTGLISNLSFLPYTVKSRQSKELEANLLKNDFPILFEVLHTCYLLNDKRFANRKKIYRHSNIEHEYYTELAKTERGFIKRLFLKIEALKLKRFEKIIASANLILAVNIKDTQYFQQNYPLVRTEYLPSFHSNVSLTQEPGRGNFVLFHGNLGISENYEAATWLIDNVFSKLSFPVVIAGLNPPAFLEAACSNHKHISLKANCTTTEMEALVAAAQVHVLYTSQPTGLKLKLLNVLFKGRFVVCNAHMVSGTGVSESSGLLIAENATDYLNKIASCFPAEFSESMKKEREDLVRNFDNSINVAKLIKFIFS